MKLLNKILSLTSVVGLSLTSINPSLALPPSGYTKLVFNDEFSGTNIDNTKWSTCYWFGCNNGSPEGTGGAGEIQYFMPEQVNMVPANGELRLTAIKNPVTVNKRTYQYRSGMISSHDKFSFTYGYLEARVKHTPGAGFWSTAWLGDARKVWKAEIDFSENLGVTGNTTSFTSHYIPSGGDSTHQACSGWKTSRIANDFTNNYHTYGVLWEPGKLNFYLDGQVVHSCSGNFAPETPMYIMFTNSIGKAWRRDNVIGVNTPLPSQMKIDYIRVYQKP